jgi:hypothetical protein
VPDRKDAGIQDAGRRDEIDLACLTPASRILHPHLAKAHTHPLKTLFAGSDLIIAD